MSSVASGTRLKTMRTVALRGSCRLIFLRIRLRTRLEFINCPTCVNYCLLRTNSRSRRSAQASKTKCCLGMRFPFRVHGET